MNDALQQFLDSVRDAPFEWGEHDCAMFAARAVDAARGTHHTQSVRAFGARSARDYRRLLRERGTLDSLTTGVLGHSVAAKIERGDVVLVGRGARAALGIAVPPVVLIAAEVGVRPLPLALAVRIWKAC